MRAYKIVFIATCIAIASILSSCSSAQHYVDRGNRLYAGGKFDEAALEYRNAVKKNARSGEAYYRLGLAELKLNLGSGAYEALSRAVALSPENLDAKRHLAELCLTLYVRSFPRPTNLYTQARSLTDELLSKNPNSPEALRLKGAIALLDNKPDDAVAALQRAVRLSPNSQDLEADLADSLFKDNRAEEGEQVARDTITKHPQYSPTYELLYSYYEAHQRESDLVAVLNLWKTNMPSDPSPVLRLAAGDYRQQKTADAETLLESLLKKRGAIPEVDAVVGDFHAAMGNREKALADYQRGESLDRAHGSDYKQREATLLAALGRRDEALKTLDSILAVDSKTQFARSLKVEILVSLGGVQNLNAAAKLAGDLATEARSNAQFQMIAGRAFMAKGDLASAKSYFQQAIKDDPRLTAARMALAQIALRRKDYPSVLENANAALAANAADPNARLLRVMGLTQSGAYSQAKKEAEQLARDSKNTRPAELQLGIIALREKNYQEAERYFQKTYRDGDSNSEALAGLMGAYIGEHQPDRALQLAETEVKRSPQSAGNAALLVTSAQAAGKPDVALSDLQKLAAQNPNSAEIQIQIGILQQAQGNLAAALGAFQRALQLAPERADIVTAIANIQNALGQKSEAIANYRKALAQTPDDPRILNNLAFTLSETHGNLNEALSLATVASRKSPANPDVQDTLAWIHVQRGESAAMIPVLAKLTSDYPTNPAYRYHYAVALFQKGDRVSAKQQLQAALSDRPQKKTESEIRSLLEQLQ